MASSDRQHETAVRYLLGELPENECDALEEAYFTREGGFEELVAIEQELIDSYVAGELSPAQRRRFESRFPMKDAGDGIEFARVLRAGLREKAPALARGARPRLLVWLSPVAAILILAGAWLAFRALSAPGQVQDAGGHNGPLPVPRDAQTPAPLPQERPVPRSPDDRRTVRVTLAAGLIRSGAGMTRVVVPADAEGVVLTLLLESGSRTGLQAVLQSAAGKELYRRGGLDAHDRGPGLAVDVPVPARSLVAGDYVVVLRSRDSAGVVADQAEYALRVIRAE
jgi:hypothetical protein